MAVLLLFTFSFFFQAFVLTGIRTKKCIKHSTGALFVCLRLGEADSAQNFFSSRSRQ